MTPWAAQISDSGLFTHDDSMVHRDVFLEKHYTSPVPRSVLDPFLNQLNEVWLDVRD